MRLPLLALAALLSLPIALGAMALPAAAQQSETENTQTAEPPMTLTRLGEIITTLDPDNRNNGAQFQMTIETGCGPWCRSALPPT